MISDPLRMTALPSLVRIKPGALDRLGEYLARVGHRRIALMVAEGLPTQLTEQIAEALSQAAVAVDLTHTVKRNRFEDAAEVLSQLPNSATAVAGIGGGRALDLAKYVAHLGGRPFYSVPTSLSHDGFCSPQASLELAGRRRSLPTRMPVGVVVDLTVCGSAPRPLWLSGVGDLVAKLTAVTDWKLAFHRSGESVNDLACLLSDATVHQFLARPEHSPDGLRLLATALMLNGIAMEIAGSSRPASGAEHLISHALDAGSARPRLHGLQVGAASYLVSRLQEPHLPAGSGRPDQIAAVLETTGFWAAIRSEPFVRAEWRAALAAAPAVKPGYFTVLSLSDPLPMVERLWADDPWLQGCFI